MQVGVMEEYGLVVVLHVDGRVGELGFPTSCKLEHKLTKTLSHYSLSLPSPWH